MVPQSLPTSSEHSLTVKHSSNRHCIRLCAGREALSHRGEGYWGWPEGTGASGRGLLGPVSKQWEQRKSSEIKTNTVCGNTKTPVTPSLPKGPALILLGGAARPGGRCPPPGLHVCEHPPIDQCTCVCVCVCVCVCLCVCARARALAQTVSKRGGRRPGLNSAH